MRASSVILLTLAFAVGSRADTIIGNALTNRGTLDGYSGQIFLLNAELDSLAGLQIGSWSFFNDNSATSVTPLLVEDVSGGTFTIRGIGQTRTSGTGLVSVPFSLVSGSDFIGTNYYVGYYDGSWNPLTNTATPNSGAVEWNTIDDAPVGGQIDSIGTIWLNNAGGNNVPVNMGVGATNTDSTAAFGGVVGTRHHSLQFVAVPEPSTALLCGLGACALLRRRRA